MNLSFGNQSMLGLVSMLAILLAACGPALVVPPSPSSTPVPPRPTSATALVLQGDMMIQPGQRYTDTSGDMEISFLDVVGFEANVNEDSDTLEVVLHMRDIPPTADRGAVKNFVEYIWMIFVYLDPARVNLEDPDYYISLNTNMNEVNADRTQIIPGTPVNVPINELFENKALYNARGITASTPQVIADPETDTITITDHVREITSNAVLSFSTNYLETAADRPDNYVPPEAEAPSTQVSPTLVTEGSPAQLTPAGTVRAYPGPVHYAGDVLTFEIPNALAFGDGPVDVAMSLDDGTPTQITATSSWQGLLLPLALDTADLSGMHTLRFTTPDGNLNEIYSFEVLPTEQRPAAESRAQWAIKESDCCIFHYITETAAARDIDFISAHFEQGARDFETVMQKEIPSKMEVYILDRIWGNGGFGGNGELVISYTDRYYGPTMGGPGLEGLARHEFTHAVGIGVATAGSGVNFNYEGMAVYVAGGHYKPEPLDKRGAALYDLGYYVPVGEFIPQHELSYLYSAAMLTYMAETYGTDKMWTFLVTDDNLEDDQPGSLEGALQSVLGVSQSEFNQGFESWLEKEDPGEQLDDLRLTVELQDLRRQYQDTYSPPANFLLAKAMDGVALPEYLPVVIREARAPANIATELIIANAQQAIIDGNYDRAEELNKVLADIMTEGALENPLAREYLEIVLAAAEQGYEIVNLEIQGDQAEARATAQPPNLIDVRFEKTGGIWQAQP